jgi:uncharacterized protein (TIGR03067 family)
VEADCRRDGRSRLPDEVLKTIHPENHGENYEVTIEGEKEPDKGTCTYDTSVKPHRMTIKSTSGPNKGKTFLAIYEMKDAGPCAFATICPAWIFRRNSRHRKALSTTSSATGVRNNKARVLAPRSPSSLVPRA